MALGGNRHARPTRLAWRAIALLGAVLLFTALMASPAETPSASAQTPFTYYQIAYASAFGGYNPYFYGGYCGIYCSYGYGYGGAYPSYCYYCGYGYSYPYYSYGYGYPNSYYPYYQYGYSVWPPYYSLGSYLSVPAVTYVAPTTPSTLIGVNVTGAWTYCTQIGGGIVWVPPGHSTAGLIC